MTPRRRTPPAIHKPHEMGCVAAKGRLTREPGHAAAGDTGGRKGDAAGTGEEMSDIEGRLSPELGHAAARDTSEKEGVAAVAVGVELGVIIVVVGDEV